MLDPIVVRPPHKGRWATYSLALAFAAGALGSILAPCEAPPPAVVVAIAPAPIAVPPVPAPAPPAPPAPAPVKDAPPPPQPQVGTTCVDDVATIGSPARDLEELHQLEGAAVVRGSCVLAAWTERALRVSWDGGQTFAALDVPDGIAQVFAAAERIAVSSRRRQLGLLYPGDTAITWLAPLDASLGDPARVFYVVGKRWIAASGPARIAASDDEGKTWRYVEPPPATGRWDAGRLADIRDDGTLIAVAHETSPVEPYDGDPSRTIPEELYETRISDGRWRTVDRSGVRTRARSATTHASGWIYAFHADKFWGCGSSSALVATRGARKVTLAEDLRSEINPFGLGVTRTAAFAHYHGRLYRLVGGTARDLGVDVGMDTRMIGVDRHDTPIFQQANRLLRWSERTGWRVLVSLPAP